MAIYPAGIIEFGSSDDAVIYQHALTSSPTEGTDKGSPVYSSSGMNMNAGGVQLDLSGVTDIGTLSTAGQMSFEVSSACIADFIPAGATTGIGTNGGTDRVNSADYFMTWAATASTAASPYGRMYINTSESLKFQATTSGGAQGGLFSTNHGAGEFTKLTFSWNGALIDVYKDHVLVDSVAKVAIEANLFSYISIGSNRGTASFTVGDYNIKNFIISNRPVMTPTHPSTAKIVFVGDSFLNQTDSPIEDPASGYDYNMKYQVEGYLREKGIGVNFVNQAVSGEYIDDAAAGAIGDQIALAIADKPNIVIYQGGTNDSQRSTGYVAADIQTSLEGHIDTLLAAGTGINKVYIGTVPSLKGDVSVYDSTRIAQTATTNSIINGMPAYWDAANPLDTGRVIVYDLFTETGGEAAGNEQMFAGLWRSDYSSYEDNLHLSSKGRKTFGRLVGRTIFNTLK